MSATGLVLLLDDADVTCHGWAPMHVEWGREHPGDSFEPRRAVVTMDDVANPQRGQTLVATLNSPTALTRWMDMTKTWQAMTGTWQQQRVLLTIFRGRITDVSRGWELVSVDGEDEPRWGAICDITAVDPLAELANLPVGDAPFPQESVTARAQRIEALTPLVWATDPSAALVAARDVDAQPAADLLDELAHMASLSGGLYFDPSSQVAHFYLDVQRNHTDPDITLDACSIGADAKSVVAASDVVNDVTVTYANPADPNAQPSARATSSASITSFGRRARTISTQLISASDAQTRAQAEATRYGQALERWEQITLGTKYGTTSKALAQALLTAGPGLRAQLTELPEPATPEWAGYVEGWSLDVDADSWEVELNLSPASWSGPLLQWGTVTTGQRWCDVRRPWAWQDSLAILPGTLTSDDFEQWVASGDVTHPDGNPVGWELFWAILPRGILRKGAPRTGLYSLRWESAAAQAKSTAQTVMSNAWPVASGAHVDAAIWAQLVSGSPVQLNVQIYSAADPDPQPFKPGTHSTQVKGNTALTNAWAQYGGSVVLPAGDVFAKLVIQVTSAAPGGSVVLLDSAMAY